MKYSEIKKLKERYKFLMINKVRGDWSKEDAECDVIAYLPLHEIDTYYLLNNNEGVLEIQGKDKLICRYDHKSEFPTVITNKIKLKRYQVPTFFGR